MKKPSVHDSLVEIVADRLEEYGYTVRKYVKYSDKYAVGEIDILAKRDRDYLIVEVKCNGRKEHATEQLHRARGYVHREYHPNNIFMMYASAKQGVHKIE